MGLQGSLRDFSVPEILQLLGTQRKTGCLMLERGTERTRFHVLEGRITSTRESGSDPDDPLMRFLLDVHRLSSEQHRGIETIQRESKRDLEDLLVNGRYLDAEELSVFVERQILDALLRVTPWQEGTYHFDPSIRWPHPPLARLSAEGASIEVARRLDEQQRFAELSRDPNRLLGVRDLPDPDEHLSEEECELFEIIDGRHTITEIVAAAPLSEYETYESLHRMIEAEWIEIAGRRDPAAPAASTPVLFPGRPIQGHERVVAVRASFGRELALAAVTLSVGLAMALGARALSASSRSDASTDVFLETRVRGVRHAVELYGRERGRYPDRLEDLVQDRWVSPEEMRFEGQDLVYRPDPERRSYTLTLAQRQ